MSPLLQCCQQYHLLTLLLSSPLLSLLSTARVIWCLQATSSRSLEQRQWGMRKDETMIPVKFPPCKQTRCIHAIQHMSVAVGSYSCWHDWCCKDDDICLSEQLLYFYELFIPLIYQNNEGWDVKFLLALVETFDYSCNGLGMVYHYWWTHTLW